MTTLNANQKRILDSVVNRRKLNIATPIFNLLFPTTVHRPVRNPFITYDQLTGGTGMLPFNKQGGEALMLQTRGYDGKGVTLPEINVVTPITGEDLYERGPGDVLFSRNPEEQVVRSNYLRKFGDAIADMRDGLTMRKEWMACQSLTGSVTYVNDKTSFTLAFDRPAGNTLTADTFWDQASANPLADIQGVRRYASGQKVARPTIAIVGSEAAEQFEELVRDETIKLDKTIDNEMGMFRSYVSDFQDSEMHFLGRVGGIDFWEYGRQETDLYTGASIDFIRPKYIEFFNVQSSTIAANRYYYGAIMQVNEASRQRIIQSSMQEMVTDDEYSKDPVGVKLFLKSRPLMVQRNPDSFFSMKVISG